MGSIEQHCRCRQCKTRFEKLAATNRIAFLLREIERSKKRDQLGRRPFAERDL
jgi:hypothetical protein